MKLPVPVMISIGAAMGATVRYGLTRFIHYQLNDTFPYGTLTVNALGSFLLGLLYVLLVERSLLPPAWRILLTVGLLGSFTTFSTFSLETLLLLREGSFRLAFMYVLASVGVGLIGVWLGLNIASFWTERPVAFLGISLLGKLKSRTRGDTVENRRTQPTADDLSGGE